MAHSIASCQLNKPGPPKRVEASDTAAVVMPRDHRYFRLSPGDGTGMCCNPCSCAAATHEHRTLSVCVVRPGNPGDVFLTESRPEKLAAMFKSCQDYIRDNWPCFVEVADRLRPRTARSGKTVPSPKFKRKKFEAVDVISQASVPASGFNLAKWRSTTGAVSQTPSRKGSEE